jgi:hypothetical protein
MTGQKKDGVCRAVALAAIRQLSRGITISNEGDKILDRDG